MTTPTSVKRSTDPTGDDIATLSTSAGHAQVTSVVPLTAIYDDSNDPIAYLGHAEPGASTASAVWRVKRIDTSSGVTTAWADGNANFDNVWNNRASLSYS